MTRSPFFWLALMAGCYLISQGMPLLNYRPITTAEQAVRR